MSTNVGWEKMSQDVKEKIEEDGMPHQSATGNGTRTTLWISFEFCLFVSLSLYLPLSLSHSLSHTYILYLSRFLSHYEITTPFFCSGDILPRRKKKRREADGGRRRGTKEAEDFPFSKDVRWNESSKGSRKKKSGAKLNCRRKSTVKCRKIAFSVISNDFWLRNRFDNVANR